MTDAPGARQVVVIGDALIDEIRHPAGVPTGDRDMTMVPDGQGPTTETVGGAGLNVAVGLARLGLDAALIAMVGDDADGTRIRRHLADHAVELYATDAPHGSARAIAHQRGHEVVYRFNRAARDRDFTPDAAGRQALAAASHVVISCIPLDDLEQLDRIRGAIHDPSTRLLIDPNPRAGMMRSTADFRTGLMRIAADARLVKVGTDDAELLFGHGVEQLAADLLAAGAAAVLTTAGADGAALYTADGGQITAPIAPAPGPIADTIGAGDATLAAITAAVVTADAAGEAVEWRTALRDAMRVAAATCRVHGGLLQLPD